LFLVETEATADFAGIENAVEDLHVSVPMSTRTLPVHVIPLAYSRLKRAPDASATDRRLGRSVVSMRGMRLACALP